MRFKSLFAILMGLSFAGAAFAAPSQPATLPVSPVTPPPLTPENVWNLDLSTGGRVSIQLRPDMAPNQVVCVKTLTRQGFYNGTIFHRVIEGFMAQGGDPTGTGTGGSQLPDVAAEFNLLPHVRGTVAAARAEDENSANSQFFIMFSPMLKLDNHYTAFGRVISGMNFVDAIERGEPPANPSRVIRASIGSDNVPPPTAAEIAAANARPLAPAAPATLPVQPTPQPASTPQP